MYFALSSIFSLLKSLRFFPNVVKISFVFFFCSKPETHANILKIWKGNFGRKKNYFFKSGNSGIKRKGNFVVSTAKTHANILKIWKENFGRKTMKEI